MLIFLKCFLISPASAGGTFSYPARSKDYSGWDSSLKGDITTVGMGGATIALPDSISAAESNPAGFAMQTSALTAQLNTNTIHDRSILRNDGSYDSNQWGVGVTPGYWGFGISYYSPKSETGTYVSPSTGLEYPVEVSVKELRFTLARAFLSHRLSLGFSLEIKNGIRNIGTYSYGTTAINFQTGILYRLPEHWVLGASVSPGVSLWQSGDADQTVFPGFNRTIHTPTLAGIGVGWVPNHITKIGVALHWIGAIPNSALLANQSILVGGNPTLQPRMGMSYVLGDFENLKIEGHAGSYYESSRLTLEDDRLHGTFGLEANPWFINTGVGIDIARDYRNIMASVGLDLVRTLRAFGWIPKDTPVPHEGFFPRALPVSSAGLPDGITEGDPHHGRATNLEDVGHIIRDIPKRIKNSITGGEEETPSVKKVKTKKKKKKKKRKSDDGE